MKFNKVLIGLMVTMPFALTSCNNTITFNQAKKWIASHYKIDEKSSKPATASTTWDFHGTKGDIAINGVNLILKALAEEGPEQGIEGLEGIIPTAVDVNNPVGQHIYVTTPKDIPQLNESNFVPFSTEAKNDVYRVTNGSFNVTYKYSEKYRADKEKEEDNYLNTTRIRTYNSKGYCTDFGCKVDGKWIDSKNTMDFKILVHFTYEDDPID